MTPYPHFKLTGPYGPSGAPQAPMYDPGMQDAQSSRSYGAAEQCDHNRLRNTAHSIDRHPIGDAGHECWNHGLYDPVSVLGDSDGSKPESSSNARKRQLTTAAEGERSPKRRTEATPLAGERSRIEHSEAPEGGSPVSGRMDQLLNRQEQGEGTRYTPSQSGFDREAEVVPPKEEPRSQSTMSERPALRGREALFIDSDVKAGPEYAKDKLVLVTLDGCLNVTQFFMRVTRAVNERFDKPRSVAKIFITDKNRQESEPVLVMKDDDLEFNKFLRGLEKSGVTPVKLRLFVMFDLLDVAM